MAKQYKNSWDFMLGLAWAGTVRECKNGGGGRAKANENGRGEVGPHVAAEEERNPKTVTQG